MECVLPTKKYGDLTFYIDNEDEQILDNHVLYVSKIDDKFYILTKDRKYLHRIIMNAPKGMVVDHINHNTLDNRKSNLRIVYNVSDCLISNIRTGKQYSNYSPDIMRRKKKWFTRDLKLVKKYFDYNQCKDF